MFGNLAEMAGMYKKFQDFQKNLKQMKEDLANTEISAKSSNGQVEVIVSGDLNVKKVFISSACIEMKDREVTESAVLEALNKALAEAKAASAKKLSEAAGGINIPGLF